MKSVSSLLFAFVALLSSISPCLQAVTITGEIVDAKTDLLIPARLYIEEKDGTGFFAESASPDGRAVIYDIKFSKNLNIKEQHTSLSAHPFKVELDPGSYTFTVERGKEYLPLVKQIEVGADPMSIKLPLQRWINMAERGWFSGDMHNHRLPDELPVIMLAEDLNVGLPMSHWTRANDVPPSEGDKTMKGAGVARLARVDDAHVIWSLNTEYEIFTTAGKTHTLGALLILNHKHVFNIPAFPLVKVAERARAEGGLLDMDKHNWPWSLAIVPLVKPDLFELTNNHLWRMEFAVKGWADPAPKWMEVGTGIDTEDDWLHFGFKTYYALLNCGFRINPSAGTASGVHPVPLGFGRVYVHTGKSFEYKTWIDGLKNGRSFVTTGPMLLAKINGELPGSTFVSKDGNPIDTVIAGLIYSEQPVNEVELIVNGDITKTIKLQSKQNKDGSWESQFSTDMKIESSSWIVVRCFESREEGKRHRFAHTAPWHVVTEGKPLFPKRQEVEWLIGNVKKEIERSAPILPDYAVSEYQQALKAYEAMLPDAK